MITRKKNTTTDSEDIQDDDEKDVHLYLTIEYERFPLETSKFKILDRMCVDCNNENKEIIVSSKKEIMSMIRQISKCCSQKDEYISIHTSMNEGVVREILAASNKPIDSEKVSASLRNRWTLTPFPKSINSKVIEKIAKSNEWIATSRNDM